MVEVISVRAFLGDIVEGKMQKPVCSGFPIPGAHEVTEWELHIGETSYRFVCPLCGFGQAGSLARGESDWLLELQSSTSTARKG